MEKKEIIIAFREAKKFYTVLNPYDNYGLCSFFSRELVIDKKNIELFLMPIWLKYKTRENYVYDFYSNNDRLKAIELILKELENEDKIH